MAATLREKTSHTDRPLPSSRAAPSFCGAEMPAPHKKSNPKSLAVIIQFNKKGNAKRE
jgi:hypothetical protein